MGCRPLLSWLACLPSIHTWFSGAWAGGRCTPRYLGHPKLLRRVGGETEASMPVTLVVLGLETKLAAPPGPNRGGWDGEGRD